MNYLHDQDAMDQRIAQIDPSVQEPELRRVHNSLQKAHQALAEWVASLNGCADNIFGAIPQPDETKLHPIASGEIGEIHNQCDRMHDLIADLGAVVSRFSRLA